MAKGGYFLEKVRRCVRTVFFMVAMVASLLVSSLPLLVAIGDMLVPCVLISSFTCVTCYGFKEHLHRYAFKSSLTDIPLVSFIRSLIITCMYLSILLPLILSSIFFNYYYFFQIWVFFFGNGILIFECYFFFSLLKYLFGRETVLEAMICIRPNIFFIFLLFQAW